MFIMYLSDMCMEQNVYKFVIVIFTLVFPMEMLYSRDVQNHKQDDN